MRLIVRILPLVLLLAQVAAAQYRFENWTTEQGLPYKMVNSVVQTRDGYVWVATDDGLARFDGVRFTVFNTANTKNLPTNRVHNLVETPDGSLWMASDNRGLIRYRDGNFKNYTAADGLPGSEISRLNYDAPENLLCAASTANAACFDGEKFFPAEIGNQAFESSNVPHFDNAGGFWLNEGDRLRRVGKDGARQIFPLPQNFSIKDHVKPFQDSAGNFWVVVDNHLLRFADGKSETFSQADGLPTDFIIAVFEDSQGNLWFGGRAGGLAVFNDAKFTLLTEKDGLVNHNINHISQDREGGVWVGTDGGLMRISPKIITTLSAADGLSGDNVYPILETRGGAVLIGSWLGKYGLDKYENGFFAGIGFGGSFLTSLFEDRDRAIWVGSHNIVNKIEDGKQTAVIVQPGKVIRAMAQDFHGNIWFGDERGELLRLSADASESVKNEYQGENGFLFSSFTAEDGLPPGGIYNLHVDRRGTLWIGTSGGLSKYENGAFTVFTEADGLSGNYVRSIYEDADGALWIGTFDNGITRLKNGRFSAIRAANGLHDNGAFQILEDDFGRFWISSNRGIYRVGRQELNDFADGKTAAVTSVAYGVRDGMLDAECNGGAQPAGFKSRKDGRLWFPTQKGVVVIDAKALPANNQPPNVVIENCLLDRSDAACENIKILPENDALEINYTGLSFVKPEQIKFKYKLEGLDENWIAAGTRRTAYFAHLPPGDYTFRVAAANVDGVWNETGASLKISVVPPFYRTFWFTALSVVGAFGLLAVVFVSRIKNLEKARAAQEEFSRRLLASQESERQRIAAELHDGLGQELLIIKNWALLGLRNEKDAGKQFDEISDTASAAIDEVREIAYNLRPYHLDELGLTKAIESMCGRVSHSSGIDFNCSIDNLDDFFPKDAEINFYRIVQECVNNVVKHSEATEARISIKRNDGDLRLSVWDNGKGFDTDSLALKRARQSGFGLAGINERARILGGKLVVNSIPAEGTNVNLTINSKDL